MIYLVNNQGQVSIFSDVDTLTRYGFDQEKAVKLTDEQFESVGGQAYIDEHDRINLGEDPRISKQRQIRNYKQYLSSTDYIDNKIIEGEATIEDYKEIINKRKEARAKIRELES